MVNAVVNGYRIYAPKDRAELLTYIANENRILIAMNAEKIMKKETHLKDIINYNIAYPDGVGAVLALKSKGLEAQKMAGAEFWLDIVKRFESEKSFYLLGATTEVIGSTITKLKSEYPNANIVGYQNGFLNEQDIEELKEKLTALKPDVVFVAQGSPRQEFLMEKLLEVHPALYMRLGGSFDVYCGLKNRAPKLFLDLQLEWLYRLMKEPTRIGRQISLVKFMALLKMGKL